MAEPKKHLGVLAAGGRELFPRCNNLVVKARNIVDESEWNRTDLQNKCKNCFRLSRKDVQEKDRTDEAAGTDGDMGWFEEKGEPGVPGEQEPEEIAPFEYHIWDVGNEKVLALCGMPTSEHRIFLHPNEIIKSQVTCIECMRVYEETIIPNRMLGPCDPGGKLTFWERWQRILARMNPFQ